MAISAHGTHIFRNGVALEEVRDVTPPPLTRSITDVTRRRDTDERLVSGRRMAGSLLFDLNWVEAKHSDLRAAWVTGVRDSYEIDFPDGTKWFFSGYVDNLATKAPVDDRLDVMVTVVSTGGVTFSLDTLLLETGDELLLEDGTSIAL